ncbi:DUF5107 domain-containing protein [Hathewaya massiliensis]|uniref:DUF5107 domain-containing protein n=1 Tax=Hathewaya massiliensis TaxID=1964382 RepID=UPI0011571FB4|nr:DUF5107 domain-containing protein [Hathewaya massiliensis]
MFKEIIFKGINALEFENNILKVKIIPSIGGKIASIYHKEKEFELLFQNKDDSYKKPELYDDFSKYDAAGFDDAFPTIDYGEVEVNGKKVKYPDHGEVWTSEFNVDEIKDNTLTLSFKSSILPYTYSKKITIEECGIKIDYLIKNLGDFDFPCIWAAHYLVNCSGDMEIIFPKGTTEVVNVQKSSKLGEVDVIHKYPMTKTLKNEEYNLGRVLSQNSNHTEKYYVNGKVNEGECSIYYKNKDLTYTLKYDREILPYLGFWVTEGGFRGDYNCALEPTNGYYDSIDIAERKNKVFTLKSGESLEFTVNIFLK